MTFLPESGLAVLNETDHDLHHQLLHDFANKLLEDAQVGDVPTKIAVGQSLGTVGPVQPHYTLDEQVLILTHVTPGQASVAIGRSTKAVVLDATANISGLTVTGMELLGPSFAEIKVLLRAVASITVDLTSTMTVLGSAPTSMAAGDEVAFKVQRWSPGP